MKLISVTEQRCYFSEEELRRLCAQIKIDLTGLILAEAQTFEDSRKERKLCLIWRTNPKEQKPALQVSVAALEEQPMLDPNDGILMDWPFGAGDLEKASNAASAKAKETGRKVAFLFNDIFYWTQPDGKVYKKLP